MAEVKKWLDTETQEVVSRKKSGKNFTIVFADGRTRDVDNWPAERFQELSAAEEEIEPEKAPAPEQA